MRERYLEDKINELEEKCSQQSSTIAKLRDQLLGTTESDMKVREAINVLVKAFIDKNFNYRLLYPSVIVRVLPKPDKYKLLFIPDEYKNKPVYEGVIMQTWEKKVVTFHGHTFTMTPEFKVGDVVLFPHWSGQPVPTFNDSEGEEWRILPDKHIFNRPGVLDDASPFILVDYDRENPRQALFQTITKWIDKQLVVEADVPWIVSTIFEEFDVQVKHKESLTNYIEPTRPD